ncbi:helix-turn-helix transcriptional regulator [Neolewinella persica]|uniref:helix-turn-helix transcriptional regulator n=1 Tax=Neolewinella persica TaxID=70998 RepID=UPI00035D968C|nr:AraC family transcriptional regulator [Neolewinella persica]
MLNLKEDPASEHVREMAAHFNAKFDNGNDASTITVNNDQAKGFISSYRLFAGLSVWVYNITFCEDFIVNLGLSEDRPYYFSYNVKGHFFHRFGDHEEFVKVLQNQNMIVVSSPENSVQIVFPKEVKLEIAVIIVDVKLLEELNIRNAKRINFKIQKIFQNIPHDYPFRHLGEIDAETGKYAAIVCKNNDIDLIGGLLTEGAVLNMLATQLRSFREDRVVNHGFELSRSELSRITSLGDYIIENLEEKVTIKELSKLFQLSQKKLQIGVKHLYGETVAHYILNLRMGQAKFLFDTTGLNVSEVCHRVGLSSQSNFSKTFKKRYGLLPSVYRKKTTS